MEDTNGIALTREVITAFPEARVVIISNYDDPELREATRSAGAHAYVTKDNLLEVPRILTANKSTWDDSDE